MDRRVAIVLIVMGSLLAAVPPASDYLHERNVTQIMIAEPGPARIQMRRPMSSEYRFGCWALGAAMIGIGVLGSLRFGHPGEGE